MTGIYKLEDGVATEISGLQKQYMKLGKDPQGNIYAGGNMSIAQITNGVATEIHAPATSGNWQYFISSNNGLYASTNNSATQGLYSINNGVVSQLTTVGYQFDKYKEVGNVLYAWNQMSTNSYRRSIRIANGTVSDYSRTFQNTGVEINNQGVALFYQTGGNGIQVIDENGVKNITIGFEVNSTYIGSDGAIYGSSGFGPSQDIMLKTINSQNIQLIYTKYPKQ